LAASFIRRVPNVCGESKQKVQSIEVPNKVINRGLVLNPPPVELPSREKAGGRYAVGFSLRLPAHESGAIAMPSTCIGTVNERLTTSNVLGWRRQGV
jgi:hypothetical protein